MPPTIDGLDDFVEIGRGGFGTVYRAHQVDPDRHVAVKVLPDVRADGESYARFVRECQALAALGGHPNIATVYSSGLCSDGSGFLSMELLPGGSMAERGSQSPIAWRDVATWGVQLCGALESAHRAGITHRDIKPENVLFDTAGTPKLVDFGIAGVPGAFRTATGVLTLTLAHAAPEVVAGGRGGVPGDVYALASTLHAALAGRPAFVCDTDETLVPMLARIATAPVPDLRPNGVPDQVCRAIERGMSKDPVERPPSAEALGVALADALAAEDVLVARPPILAASAITGAALTTFPDLPDAVPARGRAAAAAGPSGADVPTSGTTVRSKGPLAPVSGAAGAGAADQGAARRRVDGWAVVAAVAVVALLLVSWRAWSTPGSTAGQPVAAGPTGSSPAASPTARATAAPGTSPTRSPLTTSPEAATRPSTAAPTPLAHLPVASSASGSRSARTSTAPAASRATPLANPQSSSPSQTAPAETPPATTPPAVVPPAAPRSVRAVGAVVTARVAGTPSTVRVRLVWRAPAGGSVRSYDVRWTVMTGTQAGAQSSPTSVTSASSVMVVAAPAAGTWYRWEIRSRSKDGVSAWTRARISVPSVLGRASVGARADLAALGLVTTVRARATVPPAVGRVLVQSPLAGRVVAGGSHGVLVVGTAA